MTPTPIDPLELDGMIAELQRGRKYSMLELPDSTLRDLLVYAIPRYKNRQQVLQAARKKLHTLVAPYLGDPQYSEASQLLAQAFLAGNCQQVLDECRSILACHASTRERIPYMQDFYQRIFEYTGKPHVIFDLACGLNPFAIPWMNLDREVQYYAYDIHQPRLRLINQFMSGWGLPPLAVQQDILVDPPHSKADIAFFFKEAHRFEQRRHGSNRTFWQKLDVKYLLVSLPTQNLTWQRSLLERQRTLVAETLQGMDWKMEELMFPDEVVFCIQPRKIEGTHGETENL